MFSTDQLCHDLSPPRQRFYGFSSSRFMTPMVISNCKNSISDGYHGKHRSFFAWAGIVTVSSLKMALNSKNKYIFSLAFPPVECHYVLVVKGGDQTIWYFTYLAKSWYCRPTVVVIKAAAEAELLLRLLISESVNKDTSLCDLSVCPWKLNPASCAELSTKWIWPGSCLSVTCHMTHQT